MIEFQITAVVVVLATPLLPFRKELLVVVRILLFAVFFASYDV